MISSISLSDLGASLWITYTLVHGLESVED
jgi:hypothetical protein